MKRSSAKDERFLTHLGPLHSALEAYCRRGLFDQAAAEDVLQTAILCAFRDFDSFAEGTNFRAWIFRYVHLEILTANRQTRSRGHVPLVDEPLVEVEPSGEKLASAEVLLERPEAVLEHCDEALARAILKLGSLERSILLLKAIGGFKYREIAEIVRIPMGTVMSSLSRARERVREELSAFCREHGQLRLG